MFLAIEWSIDAEIIRQFVDVIVCFFKTFLQ